MIHDSDNGYHEMKYIMKQTTPWSFELVRVWEQDYVIATI